MARSDIFFFTSKQEGFGLVLLESLACGLPIISTNCHFGPSEIICDSIDCSTISNYKICKYGILTPVMEETWLDIDAPLTKSEIINLKALRYLLNNGNIRRKLSISGKKEPKNFQPRSTSNISSN